MSGRSVAIASWQIMQVFTLGSPARGPLVTVSWQYSVHLSIAFSTCVLCGNGIACWADTRTPKKSRTADDTVAWAGVKTVEGGGSAGVQADAHAAIPKPTIQQRARIRRDYLVFDARLCT